MMEYIYVILGIALIVTGFIGCFLPILPGPPLAYLALLVQQFSTEPYSIIFLISWAIVTTGITVLDYAIPPLATRKFGGTRWGMIGSTVGLLIGLIFFPPFGLLVGAFMGAFIGELLTDNDINKALKSAIGSFIGFLAGTVLKLVTVIILAFHYISNLF